jgi:hypothetical protein
MTNLSDHIQNLYKSQTELVKRVIYLEHKLDIGHEDYQVKGNNAVEIKDEAMENIILEMMRDIEKEDADFDESNPRPDFSIKIMTADNSAQSTTPNKIAQITQIVEKTIDNVDKVSDDAIRLASKIKVILQSHN